MVRMWWSWRFGGRVRLRGGYIAALDLLRMVCAVRTTETLSTMLF